MVVVAIVDVVVTWAVCTSVWAGRARRVDVEVWGLELARTVSVVVAVSVIVVLGVTGGMLAIGNIGSSVIQGAATADIALREEAIDIIVSL
jgi:hypothetical protein